MLIDCDKGHTCKGGSVGVLLVVGGVGVGVGDETKYGTLENYT